MFYFPKLDNYEFVIVSYKIDNTLKNNRYVIKLELILATSICHPDH